MSATNRIVIDPEVMLGRPVIRGTRVPVELILRKLGEGATEADLLDGYPALRREDILAALNYAADALAHEETILLPEQAYRSRSRCSPRCSPRRVPGGPTSSRGVPSRGRAHRPETPMTRGVRGCGGWYP